MKTKLLAMMLLAGGAVFAQPRFSAGVGFNAGPAVYASNIPPCPGPGYTWANGYWNAPVVSMGFGFAPRFDNHFRGVDVHGRGFERGRDFNHDRGNGFRGR